MIIRHLRLLLGLAAAISLTTTVALVWAAGRIFRVGILMQGQGANYAELARWIKEVEDEIKRGKGSPSDLDRP